MASVKQDINVGLIAFIGLVGSMLLLILVLGVQAWFAYETDAIRELRYESDQNLDWMRLRDEQYTNLGDTVGNSTIYAEPGNIEGDGYRWTSERRDAAAMPIHAAMAAVVAQNGGPEVSAEAMRKIDRENYVHLVNDAFLDPHSYVASEAVRDERQQEPLPQQQRQMMPPGQETEPQAGQHGGGQTAAGEGH